MEHKRKKSRLPKGHKYSCDGCSLTFTSMPDLRTHYKAKHPDLIEKITLPI